MHKNLHPFSCLQDCELPSFDRREAEEPVIKSMTEDVLIDYLCGRCFKIMMPKNEISEHYDIDKPVKALMCIWKRIRTMFH